MVTASTFVCNLTINAVIPSTITKRNQAAYNYKNSSHSRNYNDSNHIQRRLLCCRSHVFSSSGAIRATPLKSIKAVDKINEESKTILVVKDDQNDGNDTSTDDDVEKKSMYDIFVEALVCEGVTDIELFNNTPSKLSSAIKRSKAIQIPREEEHFHHNTEDFFSTTIGYAVADRGHRDRPGVCCIGADRGLIAHDVLLNKCRAKHLPVVVIVTRSTRTLTEVQFNDDLMCASSLVQYYRVLDDDDIPNIVHQAFLSAYSVGGPVFIDIQHLDTDDRKSEDSTSMDVNFFNLYTELERVFFFLKKLNECVIYVSSSFTFGGAEEEELNRFVELTGVPVTHSLVGLSRAGLVLYLGAGSSDLREIITLQAVTSLYLVDAGDEMATYIRPPSRSVKLKDINDILIARRKRFDHSSWAREFLEAQRKYEHVLSSFYDGITNNTEETNNNDDKITREFAVEVLDEFLGAKKEEIIAIREKEWWPCGYLSGAYSARDPDKSVVMVCDGIGEGNVIDYEYGHNKVVLDNSGWTKHFNQETRKLVPCDDYTWSHPKIDWVTNKSDLKDAIHETINGDGAPTLIVAVVDDDQPQKLVPDFRRDISFFYYPYSHSWNLVGQGSEPKSPSTQAKIVELIGKEDEEQVKRAKEIGKKITSIVSYHEDKLIAGGRGMKKSKVEIIYTLIDTGFLQQVLADMKETVTTYQLQLAILLWLP